MASQLQTVLVLLSALCLWSSVTAIQCYWCHSDTDSTCLDPYDGNSFHEFNCTSEGDQCAKATAIGKFVGIPFTQVNRTCQQDFTNQICAWEDSFELIWFGFTDTRVWECHCEGDLCNAARQTSHSVPALILTLCTAYVLKKNVY